MNNGLQEPQVLQKQVVGSSIVDCLKLIVVGTMIACQFLASFQCGQCDLIFIGRYDLRIPEHASHVTLCTAQNAEQLSH